MFEEKELETLGSTGLGRTEGCSLGLSGHPSPTVPRLEPSREPMAYMQTRPTMTLCCPHLVAHLAPKAVFGLQK